MPEISSFYALIIYLYMSEHNSPHFHAWYENYSPIISSQEWIITGSLPRRALNLVYEWLDIHKDELLENWNRLANFETPQKIEPVE